MRRPCYWLFLLALLTACKASSGPEAGTGRIFFKPANARPRGKPKQTPEWFETELASAEKELEESKLAAALERIYHARKQNPEQAHAHELERLLLRVNQAVLDMATLSARVEAERDPIVFGDPLRIRVVLRNDGPRAILIPARPRRHSRSLFIFDIVRTELDTRAQVVTTRRRVHYPVRSDIDIPAGGTTERIISLGQSGNDRPLAGFRVYTVGGALRPAYLAVGKLKRWEVVKLEPGSLRSFRPNYEHLADDPVARIVQAIAKRAGVHLLTASALVRPGRRRAAVDKLVNALEGNRPIDWAIFASLHHLTELDMGRDAAAWRTWWPRVRATYFDAPPKRNPPDVPAFR